MAVYTDVSFDEATRLVARLDLGELTQLQGIPGGIENTNYYVDTTVGRYVLSLFERLTVEQLPFYLRLMQHLAQRGLPVPEPMADAAGVILHTVHGKPAAVIVSVTEYERLTRPAAGKLSRLLLKPGLAGDALKVVRDQDTGRELSL